MKILKPSEDNGILIKELSKVKQENKNALDFFILLFYSIHHIPITGKNYKSYEDFFLLRSVSFGQNNKNHKIN